MTDRDLKFLDYVLIILNEKLKEGGIIDDIAYYYQKETGEIFPKDYVYQFENLYEGKYFERISNVGLMVITPAAKNIIDNQGSLRNHFNIIAELSAIEQAKRDNKEQLETKIAKLTEINLTLQNKQFRYKILFSIIGFIAGALITHLMTILEILKIIPPQ